MGTLENQKTANEGISQLKQTQVKAQVVEDIRSLRSRADEGFGTAASL